MKYLDLFDSPGVPDKFDLDYLVENEALFFVGHSGGKDSMAMYEEVRERVPHELIVVVHANLGEVEWPGVIDWIKSNIDHPLEVVKANYADGSEKTLLNYVEYRYKKNPNIPPWPAPKPRWCTGELKTAPINKLIRKVMKERGKLLGVNVTGIRSEESSDRRKLPAAGINKELSKAGRTVYDWRPLKTWSTADVFAKIEAAGKKAHAVYYGNNPPTEKAPKGGNERFSCVFCIFGNANDISNGSRLNPKLFNKYLALEAKTGFTFFNNESLADRAANDDNLIATDRAA